MTEIEEEIRRYIRERTLVKIVLCDGKTFGFLGYIRSFDNNMIVFERYWRPGQTLVQHLLTVRSLKPVAVPPGAGKELEQFHRDLKTGGQ